MFFNSKQKNTIFLSFMAYAFVLSPLGGITGEQQISDEDYWACQKKYFVDPASYYGSMPRDLEMAVLRVQNKAAFDKAGLSKSSNFIFYGPPGVGKTFVGSIFAQKVGADFMYVQGGELIDGFVGGGLRKPEELFKRARARRDATGKPIVMFIDEIDAVVGSRDTLSYSGSEMQLVGTLLKEIGASVNNNIIVVAATNRLQKIDAALLRSGRFEHHIRFELPDAQDREKFLLFIVKPYQHMFADTINWAQIAQVLVGCSYADLNKIINDLKEIVVVYNLNNHLNDEYIIQQDFLMQYALAINGKNNPSWLSMMYLYIKSLIS